MKLCARCGQLKWLDEFYTDRNSPSGRTAYCKPCCEVARQARRKSDPEKFRKAAAAWRWANIEKVRAIKRDWRAANRPKVRAADKKQYAANPARKFAERLRRYGLTPAQYGTMHARQAGLCAICKNPESIPNRRLSVDHNHVTGVVRGLLCANCNLLIGHAKDSPAILRAAAGYLTLCAVRTAPGVAA